jgi:F0F1-type ATP synthase membrane subunit b/b'
MLKGQINDIVNRWGPRETKSKKYDPTRFIETPEQARKLISHLNRELEQAKAEKNRELIAELTNILNKVESIASSFFRWEENIRRSVESQEVKEIKKLPLGF